MSFQCLGRHISFLVQMSYLAFLPRELEKVFRTNPRGRNCKRHSFFLWSAKENHRTFLMNRHLVTCWGLNLWKRRCFWIYLYDRCCVCVWALLYNFRKSGNAKTSRLRTCPKSKTLSIISWWSAGYLSSQKSITAGLMSMRCTLFGLWCVCSRIIWVPVPLRGFSRSCCDLSWTRTFLPCSTISTPNPCIICVSRNLQAQRLIFHLLCLPPHTHWNGKDMQLRRLFSSPISQQNDWCALGESQISQFRCSKAERLTPETPVWLR